MYCSQLRERTLQLVRNRNRTITLKKIAAETSLSVPWLQRFCVDPMGPNGEPHDYGVGKVEELYVYLSGKPLFGEE